MYDVLSLDLTNIAPEKRIVEPGKRIAELFVLDMPIGNQFKIRLSMNNQKYITISRPFSMEPTAGDANEGLFWKNDVAQAGVIVEMVVVFSDKLAVVV